MNKTVLIQNLSVNIETTRIGDEYYFDEYEAHALVETINQMFQDKNLAMKYLAVLEEV